MHVNRKSRSRFGEGSSSPYIPYRLLCGEFFQTKQTVKQTAKNKTDLKGRFIFAI
jgi:hypothetical protein